MAEEPSAGVAEAAHRLQNGLEPSVSPSGAGLSSAALQPGLQHSSNNASTGSLTASTAAGSASSATPPLGGGVGAGASGGDGALGSSRDLAAAYLAAAGHHNPEEVIGFGSGSSGSSAAGTGLQPSAAALSQFGNHQRAIAAAAAAAGLPSHFNTSVASSALNASFAASYAAMLLAGALPVGLAVVALLLGSVVFTGGELLGGPVHAALSAEAAPEHLRGRYLSLVQLTWNVAGTVAPVGFAWLLDRGAWPIWTVLAGVALVGALVALRLGRVLPLAAARVTNRSEVMAA